MIASRAVSAHAIPCTNCGGMTTPQGDGRTYVCPYCKTQIVAAIEGHQVAAGMRLDLRNIDALLATLANTLHAGFAESTRIHAQGAWVQAIEVNLDPDGFAIRREGTGVVAHYKKMVRGVALKTKTLPLDEWVVKLTDALARQASSNQRAAWVLAQLGGRPGDR